MEIKEQTKAEEELHKQLVEIAEKQSYVLLPRSYYERLFNGFEKMKRDIVRARESRDKLKEELKTLKTNKANKMIVHTNKCGTPIKDKDGGIITYCGEDLSGDNGEFAQCNKCRDKDYGITQKDTKAKEDE